MWLLACLWTKHALSHLYWSVVIKELWANCWWRNWIRRSFLLNHQFITISSDIPERSFFINFTKLRENILMSLIAGQGIIFVASKVRLTDMTIVNNILQNILGYRVDGSINTITHLTVLQSLFRSSMSTTLTSPSV